MQGLEWLDNLKLNGSYGILGSQNNVGRRDQYTLYGGSFGTAYYPIGGGPKPAQGFTRLRIGNPATSWERDKVTNIGMEVDIFEKLSFNLELYKKTVDGLLFSKSLLATVGAAGRPTVNIGDLENKGIDFSVDYSEQVSRDLNFTIGGNISTYKNTINQVPDPG